MVAHPEVFEYSNGEDTARGQLGDILREQGRSKEAIDLFIEEVRLKPNSAVAHFNLGNALPPGQAGGSDRRIPRGHAARRRSRRGGALRPRPDPPPGRSLRGGADALRSLREEVRLKPNSAVAHCASACALSDQEKPEDAIAEFREAMRLDGDQVGEAPFALGLALRRVGRYQQALDLFRELLERVA